MKTIYFYPGYDWCLTDAFEDSVTVPVVVPDDGWRMVREWEAETPIRTNNLSGVMADWFEENVPDSDEVRRFVALLRRWFRGDYSRYQEVTYEV